MAARPVPRAQGSQSTDSIETTSEPERSRSTLMRRSAASRVSRTTGRSSAQRLTFATTPLAPASRPLVTLTVIPTGKRGTADRNTSSSSAFR